MALQLRKVVEGIGSIQLARVDKTHEQIADARSVQRLVEHGILAIQDGLLQGSLDNRIVKRRARLRKETRLSVQNIPNDL